MRHATECKSMAKANDSMWHYLDDCTYFVF